MNINADKFFRVISSIVIVYCLYAPIAAFLTFPTLSFGINIVIYLIWLPIIAWHFIGEGLGKYRRGENFVFWDKLLLIGSVIALIFLFSVFIGIGSGW